jgi:hypothetical protein
MPNEPANSLQKGGSNNLLVAELSVDGLNLLDVESMVLRSMAR